MKRNSLLLVNSTHKTKPWWVFLSVLLLVVIPFVIVWILVGEFNVLNQHWIIGKGQVVWSGIITEKMDLEKLAGKYAIYFEGGYSGLLSELESRIGEAFSIASYKGFFDPIVLAPLLGLFALAIFYPLILNAAKVSGLDVLPFSSGSATLLLVYIITALIPVWQGGFLILYFFVRLIIALASGIIIFFLFNLLVNAILARKDYAADIYFGYKVIDQENAAVKQGLKDDIDEFNKQKDKETSYVELPKED